MEKGAASSDEELLDRLFGSVEEIEEKNRRAALQADRYRGWGHRGVRFAGYSGQPPEVTDDWEASEVGND